MLADADKCFDTATYLIDETSLIVPATGGVLQVFGNSEKACQIVTKRNAPSYTVNVYVGATKIIGLKEDVTEEDAEALVGKPVGIYNVATQTYKSSQVKKTVAGTGGEGYIQLETSLGFDPQEGDMVYFDEPSSVRVRTFSENCWSPWIDLLISAEYWYKHIDNLVAELKTSLETSIASSETASKAYVEEFWEERNNYRLYTSDNSNLLFSDAACTKAINRAGLINVIGGTLPGGINILIYNSSLGYCHPVSINPDLALPGTRTCGVVCICGWDVATDSFISKQFYTAEHLN